MYSNYYRLSCSHELRLRLRLRLRDRLASLVGGTGDSDSAFLRELHPPPPHTQRWTGTCAPCQGWSFSLKKAKKNKRAYKSLVVSGLRERLGVRLLLDRLGELLRLRLFFFSLSPPLRALRDRLLLLDFLRGLLDRDRLYKENSECVHFTAVVFVRAAWGFKRHKRCARQRQLLFH